MWIIYAFKCLYVLLSIFKKKMILFYVLLVYVIFFFAEFVLPAVPALLFFLFEAMP